MAVEASGSAILFDSASTSGSQSITVPAGTTMIVAISATYHSASYATSPIFSLDGTPFTRAVGNYSEVHGCDLVTIEYLNNPTAGARTLSWSIAAVANKLPTVIAFYKGTNGLRSTSGALVYNYSSTQNPLTVTGMSYQPGDMMVGGVATDNNVAVSAINGQTEIGRKGPALTGGTLYCVAVQKADTGDFYVTNTMYATAGAIVIAADATGTTVSGTLAASEGADTASISGSVTSSTASKPAFGTPLRSDGHWSVTGLTNAVIFDATSGYDHVTATRGTLVGGATVGALDGEHALTCVNASGQAFTTPATVGEGVNTGTIVLRFKPTIASNSTAKNTKFFDNSAGRRVTVYINPSPGRIDCYNDGKYTYYSDSLWTVGQRTTLAYVYDKTTARQDIYIDGVKKTSNGGVGSWGSGVVSGNLVIGNRDNFASQGAEAPIYSVYYYNRQLTDAEIQSLSTDPWQIFSAGTPTTITGTLAVTEATDTAAMVGGVGATITGTLAATEATDTAAMLAAVVKSVTTGALAATEGTDTSAASGTVTKSTLTGTLAATEVADTIAVSGGVGAVVAGTLAVTEGTDTAAITGTVRALILGTLDATEAIDTAAASGTVVWDGIVRGIMEALEGADVANCRGVNHYRWTGPITVPPGTVLKAVAVKVEKEIKTQQYTAPIPVGTGKTVKYRVVSSKGQVGGIVVVNT